MDHVLGDMRLYHDDVQLRCFVLNQNGHGSIWGIYRQCLMELDSRRCSLAGRKRDVRESHAELTYARVRASKRAWTAKGRRDRELARIEVTKYEESIQNLDQQVGEILRELRLILKVASHCKDQLGTVSDERRQKLNRSFWALRFTRQAKLAYSTAGRLDAGMIDAMAHLPSKEYRQVMRELLECGIDIDKPVTNLRRGSFRLDDECRLELIESGWQPKLVETSSAS